MGFVVHWPWMRGIRRAAVWLCLPVLALTFTGCSEYDHPSAVFLEGGRPKVAVKECRGLRGIAKLAVRRGRYGDKRLPEVWVARLRPGSSALFEIPLSDEIPGYTVTTRAAFEPTAVYVFESVDVSGAEVAGAEFRFRDLVEGRVVAYDAGTEDRREFSLRNWRLTKEDCPEIRKSEAMEFGSFGLLMLIPLTITAAAFALEFRRRRRQRRAATPQPPN